MISIEQVLTAEFEALKEELAAAYSASGASVTGNWAQQLEVKASGTGAQLWGTGYIEGRKPGTPPPSEAIEQWIVAKGIASRLENDMSISSLAFIIARKIGREGWKPEEGSVIKKVITAQRIQQIIDKAGMAVLPEFTSDIIHHLKTIAV